MAKLTTGAPAPGKHFVEELLSGHCVHRGGVR
jgi:hypothetical protein